MVRMDNISTTKEKLIRSKRPRKSKDQENQPGKYDERNTVNDLTGKEWLLLSRSYWFSEPTVLDKTAYSHPAPFMVKDIENLIQLFTKKDMLVLDPFVGSGTTLIAASNTDRKSIGIDLNAEYYALYQSRLKESQLSSNNSSYIVGDSLHCLDDIDLVDYIVTSPPYHNILRNDSKGTRCNNGKQYRMSARDGVEYYSDLENDIGNCAEYTEFMDLLFKVMTKAYACLNAKRYISIIMSDFTVNKKEMPVLGDVTQKMISIGFEYCGSTVLLQNVKPLYPFGYPYAYKINHHHQSILTFRKPAL